MKKILFLNPYPENVAPSQRLKFEQYYPVFESEGFILDKKAFISEDFWQIVYKKGMFGRKILYTILAYFRRFFQLFTIRKYDVVYVHLWVTPYGPPVFEFFVCLLAKKVVYDIDDLIFTGHTSRVNKFFKFLKGKNKMIYLMKHADHVITCTPFLDTFVRKYNQHTTDISSTVDTAARYLPTENKGNKPVIIGWSGSHSTSRYLHLLDEALQMLAKETDFELVVMGDSSFAIEGVRVKAMEWRENIEMDTLRTFDIGLYPLPYEEWVLGKSGLKAIQYMALGIPTVATDVGTIHRIIEHEKNGFLVADNQAGLWKEYLLKLIGDHQLREEMGKLARRKIVAEYSIEANKDKYLDVFRAL
ncbi:MAG: glycosyltransferase [Crocinitomicaceae bacterium]|jgi:glycosyltransferase involved in cell wall biosynthesis|nr:glycosyltransferase [Crocinitomicaceae bacterium]